MDGSSPVEQEVKLGTKNSDYVLVVEVVKHGDKVTLRDPNAQPEEPKLIDGIQQPPQATKEASSPQPTMKVIVR